MSDFRRPAIQPLPKPRVRPSRRSVLTLWVLAAGGLILSALLAPLVYRLLNGVNVHLQQLAVNLLYYLPFVVLPCLLLMRRNPGMYEACRPNPISLFNTISIAVLAVLGVFMVNDIVVLWSIPLQKLGLNPLAGASLPPANTSGELMLSVISIAVVPAVSEELLFRGTLMPAFEGEGSKRAMRITALLFMLIHGSFAGMPSQYLLGVVLAMLVFWTDSIYAGIIYHTVHNAASVILDSIQTRTVSAEPAVDTSDLYAAIGGLDGVLSLLIAIALSGAMFWFSLRIFRLRGQFQGIALEETKKQPLARRDWIVLLSGAGLCLLLYVFDFINMLGLGG